MSGTITSKPASASGRMLRHQIRFVSGQPWSSSRGKPPTPSCTVRDLYPAHLRPVQLERATMAAG